MKTYFWAKEGFITNVSFKDDIKGVSNGAFFKDHFSSSAEFITEGFGEKLIIFWRDFSFLEELDFIWALAQVRGSHFCSWQSTFLIKLELCSIGRVRIIIFIKNFWRMVPSTKNETRRYEKFLSKITIFVQISHRIINGSFQLRKADGVFWFKIRIFTLRNI